MSETDLQSRPDRGRQDRERSTVNGAHPWSRDHPIVQLRWELRAYRDFLNRGGKTRSQNGRRRRKRIRELAARIEGIDP